MRDFCGTPDKPASTARFVPGPGKNVWPKRQFTYAFDPERNCKDTGEVSVKDARSAVRRAFGSWEEAGVELAFTEVSVDDDPDVTIQWVSIAHSGPGEEHDTLGEYEDDDGNTIQPVAHAPFPPKLTDLDFTPRYICFDDEEQTWFVAPDTNNDDTADDVPAGYSDIEEVAVHEIGHFLGLDHSDKAGAVMQQGVRTQRSLGDDDIAGIRDLYPPQGRARFNAIWTKDDVPRKALHQIDEDDLKALLDDEKEDGWRPTRITSYQVPGEPRRYNVVLDEIDDSRPYEFGRSKEFFETRSQELEDEGFEPISISAGGDGEAWSGVWAKDDAHTLLLRIQTTDPDIDRAGEMAERAIANLPDGVRPMEVDTYVDANGVVHWLIILWENDVRFRVHLGRTREEFEELIDELEELDEWGPTAIGTYMLPDGSDRWNAVFQQTDFAWRTLHGYGGHDVRNELVRTEASGLEAWMLNAFVLPAPTSTTTLTTQVVTQPAPPAPTLEPESLGVAVDAKRVYATRYLRTKASPHNSDRDGKLVIADRNSLAVVHPGITVGHQPRDVAVNPATGRIYVVNWGKRSYSLTAIDGTSFEVLDTIDLKQGPLRVAVNPTTNRVYVTNWFQGRVHVIDGDTHQPLAPIELGKGTVGIAVDPARNQVYVTIVNLSVSPFRNGLYRITDHADGTGYAVEPFIPIAPLAAQSQDVTVDAKHDRVYVANLGGGGVQPSVSVLHRSDLGLLATIPMRGPGRAIASNSDAREVYVATDRGVELIDGATNAVTTLLDGHFAWDIAAAPGGARQLFLADRDGDLTRAA